MEHALDPEVIYEDEDFLAVSKPAGLLVHGIANKAGRKDEPTLVDWLLARYPEIKNVGDPSTSSPRLSSGQAGQVDPLRPGIVHRLDRDTSGVMLVAKNQKTFDYLKSLFMGHEIQKEYIAIVWGTFKEKEGVIDAPLGIVSGSTKRSTRSEKMAKPAVTYYKVSRTFDVDGQTFSLVHVFPKTGRTHQIRVHLASIGHPILGDALYGRRANPSWASRLMLHASVLQFQASAGSVLRIEAPLPKIFSVAGV